jgi:hypothetical protein
MSNETTVLNEIINLLLERLIKAEISNANFRTSIKYKDEQIEIQCKHKNEFLKEIERLSGIIKNKKGARK